MRELGQQIRVFLILMTAGALGLAPATPLLAAGAGTQNPPAPPGFTARAAGSAPRGVTLPAATGGIPLLPPWSLVSFPGSPADPDPGAVFSSLAGQVARVYAYDACDGAGSWKVWDPADPGGSDLTAIDPRQGLWVEALGTASLAAPAAAPATTIRLCPGWNLIGYPASQARPAAEVLAPIAGKYLRVFGFDPADPADPWEILDVAVPAWANDLRLFQPGRGYWILAREEAELLIAGDASPPVVAIASPAESGLVTGPADVIGTVAGGSLTSWELAYRPEGEGEDRWTTFATGATPVRQARLGVFDPTLLLNGGYEIRLAATDLEGVTTEVEVNVSVEGDLKLGPFSVTFTDLEVPLAGLPIQVLRTYDSRETGARDFGIGWTLEIRQGSYRNNRKPGEGWQLGERFLPCDTVEEALPHVTTIRLSDQEVYRFRLALYQGVPTLGGCFARARFDFADGPVRGATLSILGSDQVLYQNSASEVVDPASLEIFEPREVRLTTRDGRVFDLHLRDGVTRLQDRNGNSLALTPAGITHSSGRSIAFERDAQGRITRITDPLGESLVYEYDAAGDLVAVTDREDATTRFTYAAHRLMAVKDPLGRQPIRNEYDDAGRLIRYFDAAGKAIEHAWNLDARTEVITNRLGRSTLLEYDRRGNIVREVDPLGGVTLRVFDDRDHLLSQTNPLGETTTSTWHSDNLTSVTDPLGNRTTYTHNALGQILTTTDPRGGVSENTYDAQGNLLTRKEPDGSVTTIERDLQGNATAVTDPLGRTTRREFDAHGQLLRETDPLDAEVTYTYDAAGNRLTETRERTTPSGPQILVISFAYDANGRALRIEGADGTAETFVYDPLGNLTSRTDGLDRTTGFVYDSQGRRTTIDFPDGTTELTEYDAEGRRTATVDRGGRRTTYVLDDLGRLIRTVHPDGTANETAYDKAGRPVGQNDARGGVTAWENDAAGRPVRRTDPLGQVTEFAYDKGGNQTAWTDSLRRTTRFEYDSRGRRTRVLQSDGAQRVTAYDALGRVISETDEAGRSVLFGHDALGRLTLVTDPLGQTTRFAYDEVGNLVTRTDAAGRITRFEHDGLGRMTRRTLPDGASETFSYDAEGNLTRRTGFDGQALDFAYDQDDRLIRKSWPGGGTAAITYTANGQRASVVDARGTTLYTYDSRDRLIELVQPDGRKLTWSYDAAGNRTAVTAQVAGQTLETRFSWDPLDRLDTVTDPEGRVYDQDYDPAGNRTALTFPNGLRTDFAYDSRDRLTGLRTDKAGTGAVLSFDYRLGAAGHRLRVDEQDGTRRDWTFDGSWRLTGEAVSGTAPAATTFSYDPVGNRLSRSEVQGGSTAETAATYDLRDRLATLDGAAWTWDANGRLTAAAGAVYQWSLEDRLVRIEQADGTVVTHEYDVDGVLQSTRTTRPDGASEVRSYLVDVQGDLSQVLAETDEAGQLVAWYVRGEGLLGVLRPGGDRFYHADALGSVRALSDERGEITDRYSYAAFGELRSHTGSDANPYLFAGERVGPGGLVYLRARWLDPVTGRFLSADPYPGVPNDPRSLHGYLYAHLDPVDNVDPTGLFVSFVDVSIAQKEVMQQRATTASAQFRHLYKARYVRSLLKAIDHTLEVLDVVESITRAANGDVVAAMEVLMTSNKGRLDIWLKRSKLGQRWAKLELKAYNFDDWQWMPSWLQSKRIDQVVDQARRFTQDRRGSGVAYVFQNTPQSDKGKEILITIMDRLNAVGVERVTVGKTQLDDYLKELLLD